MGLPIPDNPDPIIRLREIVHCLRAPGGCPWDIEQTHESLIANLLEEAYEVAAAIRSEDTEHMIEELGDLLLQVVMHAEIASETDRFVLEDIARVVGEKLIRRHPHVFGESDADNTEDVLKQWEAIKLQEKGSKRQPYLKDVGEGLPALLTATKLQKKASKVGFDWEKPEDVFAKVKEEVGELEVALSQKDAAQVEEEFGDLFFSLVNLARKHGLDSESVMANANEKFRRRFHKVEDALLAKGQSLEDASLEEMDLAWNQVKVQE